MTGLCVSVLLYFFDAFFSMICIGIKKIAIPLDHKKLDNQKRKTNNYPEKQTFHKTIYKDKTNRSPR